MQRLVAGAFDRRVSKLLARAATGDQVALARLYDATASRVLGLISTFVSDPEVAQRITHDTFLEVWRRAPQYRRNLPPMTWMLLIARALVAHQMMTNAELASEDEEPSISEGATN